MLKAEPLTKELVLSLKEILERKNGRSYTFDEAARIGRGLVEVYSELADNPLGIGHIRKKGGEDERSLNKPL